MRRDTWIRRGEWNLVWFIAVPTTNIRYSAAYTEGFQGFKIGDGVRLIHIKADVNANDYTGYIIGLHDNERGQVANVEAIDLDELEMDLGPEN